MKPLTRTVELRRRLGLTQLQLASRTALGLGAISRLEGIASLEELDSTHLGTLRIVADALGVSLVELVPSLDKGTSL